MLKKQKTLTDKTEDYLGDIEEAKNLFEALDFPPSRIRAILARVFNDYFNGKIKEEILLEVGGILHELQIGTWDYDPDITSITCSLDDFRLEENSKAYEKKKREKFYRMWYKDLLENQTIPVSLPTILIKKLEKKNMIVQESVKQIFLNYFKK